MQIIKDIATARLPLEEEIAIVEIPMPSNLLDFVFIILEKHNLLLLIKKKSKTSSK